MLRKASFEEDENSGLEIVNLIKIKVHVNELSTLSFVQENSTAPEI